MLFGLGNFSFVKGIAAYLILAFADYIVAFGCFGLGGIFKKKIKNPVLSIALGGALVSVIRFICHFISGVTIWGDYSDGAQAVWEYSLTYNAGYMVPELIITVLGCAVLCSIFDLESSEIKVRKRNK
jgi:thiamine transporter